MIYPKNLLKKLSFKTIYGASQAPSFQLKTTGYIISSVSGFDDVINSNKYTMNWKKESEAVRRYHLLEVQPR